MGNSTKDDIADELEEDNLQNFWHVKLNDLATLTQRNRHHSPWMTRRVTSRWSIRIYQNDMTQRQWITHPFDIDVKWVPSLKMTQWTTA